MPDSAALTRFFETYQHHLTRDSFDSLVSQFAETFLVGSPQGTATLRREQFSALLRRRALLFREHGCTGSRLLSLTERPLSSRYLLAETQWGIAFTIAGELSREVIVNSTFLLDTGGEPWQIVAYLAHQDPLALLGQSR